MGGGVVVRKLFEGSQERDVEVKLGKGEGMVQRPSYGGDWSRGQKTRKEDHSIMSPHPRTPCQGYRRDLRLPVSRRALLSALTDYSAQ